MSIFSKAKSAVKSVASKVSSTVKSAVASVKASPAVAAAKKVVSSPAVQKAVAVVKTAAKVSNPAKSVAVAAASKVISSPAVQKAAATVSKSASSASRDVASVISKAIASPTVQKVVSNVQKVASSPVTKAIVATQNPVLAALLPDKKKEEKQPVVQNSGLNTQDVDLIKNFLAGERGKLTTESVKAFQKKMGLDVDGIVGPKTKAAMESVVPKQEKQIQPPVEQKKDTGYRFYKNNMGYYEVLPWGGNTPSGYTEISKDEFLKKEAILRNEDPNRWNPYFDQMRNRPDFKNAFTGGDSGYQIVDGVLMKTQDIPPEQQTENIPTQNQTEWGADVKNVDYSKVPENFDANSYMAANPDLGRAGIDTEEEAKKHFALHGYKENRQGVSAPLVPTNQQAPATQQKPANAPDTSMIDEMIKVDPFLAKVLSDPAKKSKFMAMPPELQQTYLQLAKSTQQKIESGQVINPSITIEPSQVKKFLDQATTELEPYYKEQISFHKKDLDDSLARMTEDYGKTIQREGESFKTGMEAAAESEAGAGTTYSSGRVARESANIAGQQNKLSDLSTELLRRSQDEATSTERKIGTEALGGIPNRSINLYNVGKKGFTQAGGRSLFNPTGNLLGELPKAQITDINQRKSELEGQYRQSRNLNLSGL